MVITDASVFHCDSRILCLKNKDPEYLLSEQIATKMRTNLAVGASVLLIVISVTRTDGGMVEFKPPTGLPQQDDSSPVPDFSKIKSEDVLAALGAPKKVIDPRGVDLMSLTKVCTPSWLGNGSSEWLDAKCMKWPEVCDYMPSPAPAPFAVFTEMFPCWILDKSIMLRITQLQHASLLSIEKCMWDYILMFLNACYPGLDPRVLINMIQSGRLVNDLDIGVKVNMDQSPITAPPLFG